MKKLIIFTIVVLIIPFFVYKIFYQEQEKQFDFIENTFVRVNRHETNQIEIIPMEEYITGVVAGEMPISFPLEALKAQAVAARSYVLKKMEQNINNNYDVIDTVSNQVYLDNEQLKTNWKTNYIKNINKIREAVYDTAGEYLTYNGEVINAFFFSTSVGKTENSEDIFSTALPYLKSVDSSWDEEVSPVFSDSLTLNLKDFYSKLNISYNKNLTYKIETTTSTGRVKKIEINNIEFTGQEIAQKLNLRSSFFSFKLDGDNIIISTKGYGHGVGMSQYGAYGMANKGYKYDEILKYYYQGVEISKK